jgi:hypothetical protein
MIVNYALSLLHLVNCALTAPGNAEIISVLGAASCAAMGWLLAVSEP